MCNNSVVKRRRREGLAGKVAAWSGAICAVHCLLTAIGLGLLSTAGLGFLGNPAIEIAFLVVAVVAGVWALAHGIGRHHSYLPAAVFSTGLAAIAAGHFVFGESFPALTIFGGLCIAGFQLLNMRMQHRGCVHSVDRSGHAVVVTDAHDRAEAAAAKAR